MNTSQPPRLQYVTTRSIATSVFFQQLLYYEVFFDIEWGLFWLIRLMHKFWKGLKFMDGDLLRTIFLILWTVQEPIRMTAGFYGNLQENVPWLGLFCFMCFMPTIGPVIYLWKGSWDRNALTDAVQVAQLLMLLAQFVTGIVTMILIARKQKIAWFLFDFALRNRMRQQHEAERAVLESATAPAART